MAADGRPAGRATPSLLLLGKKSLHTAGADGIEVRNHAHVIFFAVAFVEGLQPHAGELPALKAKTNQSFAEFFAAVPQEGAVLIAGHTAGAILFIESLFLQIVFHREETDAQCAVHPAWRDEFFFHSGPSFRCRNGIADSKIIAREIPAVTLLERLAPAA